MNYNWFKIFNYGEFLASGLVQKKYTLLLDGIGEKEFLATHGQEISLKYDGIFLTVWLYHDDVSNKNPFEFDDHAIFVDPEGLDVYWGLPIED